jgi:hypothetical protein
MKNVNLFQVIFYAANAAGGLDASFDAGFRVDNFVCVDNGFDNTVDDTVDDSVDNSVDDGFDDNSVDNSVDDGFDDDSVDRAD